MLKKMFTAMQDALDSAKEEFNKKFEGRAKAERKMFSFGTNPVAKKQKKQNKKKIMLQLKQKMFKLIK